MDGRQRWFLVIGLIVAGIVGVRWMLPKPLTPRQAYIRAMTTRPTTIDSKMANALRVSFNGTSAIGGNITCKQGELIQPMASFRPMPGMHYSQQVAVIFRNVDEPDSSFAKEDVVHGLNFDHDTIRLKRRIPVTAEPGTYRVRYYYAEVDNERLMKTLPRTYLLGEGTFTVQVGPASPSEGHKRQGGID